MTYVLYCTKRHGEVRYAGHRQGVCAGPYARPGPGRTQRDLRQGLSAGRQRGVHRRAGAVCRRGGTQRLRAGVPGRAGDGVAHRGGQMPVRYASSAGGAGRKALRGRGDGDTPPCRRLRCRGRGLRPGAERGQRCIGERAADVGKAAGAGRRRHKRAGGAYRYIVLPPGLCDGADAPRRGTGPHRRRHDRAP